MKVPNRDRIVLSSTVKDQPPAALSAKRRTIGQLTVAVKRLVRRQQHVQEPTSGTGQSRQKAGDRTLRQDACDQIFSPFRADSDPCSVPFGICVSSDAESVGHSAGQNGPLGVIPPRRCRDLRPRDEQTS